MRSIDPSYALGLILLLVVVGAGATVGLTLAGSIVGQSVTTVNQAVIIPADQFSDSDVGVSEAVVTVGDQGTKFAVGAEAFQGDTYGIEAPVQNQANGAVTTELVLSQVSGPDPVSVDVKSTSAEEFGDGCNIKNVVQVGEETWRFNLDSGCNDRVRITISLGSKADPGFYKISGELKPLEGIE